MRALLKMTWVEIKLFMREPVAVFFTLAFPLLLLFLFGSIYGNEPSEFLGRRGSVDLSIPGYIALIIGTIGMIGLPVSLASYREQGILRRFRATPLRPATVLGAQVLVQLLVSAIGVILLVLAGWLAFDLQMPSLPISVVIATLLSAFSFFALSFVLAGLLPTTRTAQAVGTALFYPMLFLSGAALPRQLLPDMLVSISQFLPLTHVVTLLQDLWLGQGWNIVSTTVLLGLLLVGCVVSARTFRWDKL
ncbi:MAG: ABC transporter permease [Chloroflexales bacterium]|nr:ABC transporter permease [Chloroflexales bacterium]